MAEGAVSFLCDKIYYTLRQEAELLRGVCPDVQYISDELEFMKAFMPMADAVEDEEPLCTVWVKQVRDVAHDMEDSLDDFMIRLAHNHDCHGLFAILEYICCSIKTLHARHRMALRLRDIKSRVVSISEAYRRYLIRNNPVSLKTSFGSVTRLGSRGDALLLEESDLVGIEKPKNQLIGWLVADNAERKVVSVVGMGGLGKTTLAKKVYDDVDVKKLFKCCAWITVSRSFNAEDLLKDILNQMFQALKKPVPPEVASMRNGQLLERIRKFLHQKKYLIVLDDVWHIDAWDAVKRAFPRNSNGSRVLITTRNTEVASTASVDSPGLMYPLHPLSPQEAWTLFSKKVFRKGCCPHHLKDVSESILGRCEGLPLAIVAISGVLATKDKSKIDEWEIIRRSLGSELEGNDKLKSLTKILLLSYDDLPYYLQSCYLYLSIFPEDLPIDRKRLTRLWIAEGFVKEKDGRTPQEVADGYFNELLIRSLIQVAESTNEGRARTCRIHDLLREIIILKSRDQNFVVIAKEQNIIWQEKVRRVSIHNKTPVLQLSHMISHLRSLLLFWGSDSSNEPSKFKIPFNGLRLLNVLHLQGAPLTEFPREITELTLLKYLSLRNTLISSVPGSIQRLQKLETLDLKQTLVEELPVEILKLQKLHYLPVYHYDIEYGDRTHTKYGFKAPGGIVNMQSLQKLCFISVDRCEKVLLTELGKLQQLRRLGIVKCRKEDGKALCSSIEKLVNLLALSISSIEESEIIDVHSLFHPPPFLQRLYLSGRLEKLPGWIPSLHSLEKVVLKWSELQGDPMLSFQHLPNLAHLELMHVCDAETLLFRAEGFQKLNFLGLNKWERLRSITFEEGAMPCLEKLFIHSCKLLQKVPSGIEHLLKVKVLELIDMPYELITKLCRHIEGEDYQKVAHISEVYCTCLNNESWDVFYLECLRDGASSSMSKGSNKKRKYHVW